MHIACSAEQRIFEIPRTGEAIVGGVWSPEIGLSSRTWHLKWQEGRLTACQSADQNTGVTPETLRWDSYFLMPGWIDAHVHLALDSLDFYQCLENWHQPAFIEANMQNYLAHYLEMGITAIRDGGDLPGFAWMAKKQVQEQNWLGPEVISVHEAVNRAGMYGRFLGRGFKDISEWRENKQDFFSQGLDQLKVVVTGLIKFDVYQKVGPTQWSVAELAELVQAAHEQGIMVMAHASGEAGIAVAVAAGVDTIEHGYYMTTELLEEMSHKEIAWVPTAAPIGNILKYPTDRYSAHEIATLQRILEGQLTKIGTAYEVKVRLGVGTDAGAYRVPHADSLYDEMDWLIEAGIPKLEVYKLATLENARIVGRPELGKLGRGTLMSSLQLAKNPG